jgi:nonribosomal peptide synthetase protein VioO
VPDPTRVSDLVSSILELAERKPGQPAIVHRDTQLTYPELAAAVRATAARLGPEPGTVGVHVAHRPDTVVDLLGIWAAGGTYLPIDPAFPAERQRQMRDAAASTEPDAAYILFTSGSTGAPKPVATPRRAIATTVAALRDLFGITPADRVLQFASLSWDTCFEEILPTLTGGATLVFDDETHTGSFPRFLRAVRRQAISVLDLPSAYWHELVLHLVSTGEPLPERLRLVIIGGEPVNPARLADWRRLDTGRIRLLNTYGCTETTLITHAVDLHGPAADPCAGTPIGRPLPHVHEKLSEDGELLIGGPALALGYHRLPDATAARFVEVDGDRFFRTGDRVSRRPDGCLLHEGRLDGELKIRGIRVNPAEVEANIAAHPSISGVAVVGVPLAGHTVLAAYLVPQPGVDADGLDTDVRRFLRERAPAHLIPARSSIVSALAYTASGKVDRAGSHRRFAAAVGQEER